MNITEQIFNDGSLRNYIDKKTFDPWIGTLFEGYAHMDPLSKGTFGERYIEKYLSLLGFGVTPRINNDVGHDRVINSIPTELKFSISHKDNRANHEDDFIRNDQFIINHVSKCKSWERLLFIGINKTGIPDRILWFTKESFEKTLNETYFKYQQGGKKGENDDRMCSSMNVMKLYNDPLVHNDFACW